jgi:hypothetical protein
MLELLGFLAAPGAIASFGVGTVIIVMWMLSPAILKQAPLSVSIVAMAVGFSIPWWMGAFLGAAGGIAARNVRRRRQGIR